MPRTKVEVDRDELVTAIETIETDGPLSSAQELYVAISGALGVSTSVVKNRIETWKLATKTKIIKRNKRDWIPSESTTKVSRLIHIHTPAGKCPVQLRNSDDDSVLRWMEDVKLYGEAIGYAYSPVALLYFSRQFFDIFSPEHRDIKRIIANYAQQLISEEQLVSEECL